MKIFNLLPTTAPSISRSKAAYHRKGTGYCWGLGRLFGIVVLGLIFQSGAVRAAEQAVVIAAPTQDISGDGLQTVVFAGGCFWGVQGVALSH